MCAFLNRRLTPNSLTTAISSLIPISPIVKRIPSRALLATQLYLVAYLPTMTHQTLGTVTIHSNGGRRLTTSMAIRVDPILSSLRLRLRLCRTLSIPDMHIDMLVPMTLPGLQSVTVCQILETLMALSKAFQSQTSSLSAAPIPPTT